MRIASAFAFLAGLLASSSAFGVTVFDFDELPDSSGCNPPVNQPLCDEYLDLLGRQGRFDPGTQVHDLARGKRLAARASLLNRHARCARA